MASPPTIVIVTGASRGVGLGIARSLLAQQRPQYTLWLTSTSGSGLPSSQDGRNEAHHAALDVSDPESIKKFASLVEKKHGAQSVQALINNAGINLDQEGFKVENTKRTLQTNYGGIVNMCNSFLPLLKKGGRIVNLASVAGHLRIYSKEVQEKFKDASESVDAVDQLYKEYLSLLEAGKDRQSGFPQQAYSISKAFVIAYTRALARAQPDYLINSACPGWVNTDMGNQIGKPPKTLEDGAKIPVRLAVGDIGNVSGEFWENDSISSSADGKVSVW